MALYLAVLSNLSDIISASACRKRASLTEKRGSLIKGDYFEIGVGEF